jgi:tetratricopeptide (TPR) repeat protein
VFYSSFGQYDRALTEVQRGVVLDPNSAYGYLFLAEVLNDLGKPTQALIATERAIRLDPRNTINYVGEQGRCYELLERWDASITPLKLWLARVPNDYYSHARLAQDYGGLGDNEASQAEVAEVQRLVALEPNSAIAYLALADASNGAGRPTQALAALKEAIRLDPSWADKLADRSMSQGWAYSQLGRWQQAISVLKRYQFTDLPRLHVLLAVDYVELGRDDAARTEVAEILRLYPQISARIGGAAFPANRQRAVADLRKAGLN